MNHLRIFSVLLIIWAGLAGVGKISAEPLTPSTQPNQGIPVGERLTYQITWLRIPVGTGELWAKEKIVLNGRDVIHVVGFIETNKVLRTIFPMHDEAHSWIDAETFESVQFEKKWTSSLLMRVRKWFLTRRRKKVILSL